jgi:hypothetical protein
MHMTNATRTFAGIAAAALLSLAVGACYAPGTSVPPQPTALPPTQPVVGISPQPVPPTATPAVVAPQGGEPSTPLVVSLWMDKAPLPGEEARIVLEMTAYMDAPGTTAAIELPAQAELTGGDLKWQGDVLVGTPVRLVATVVFKQAGSYAIRGSALRPVDEGMTWGDAQDIFLTVADTGSFFGLEGAGGTQLSASPAP